MAVVVSMAVMMVVLHVAGAGGIADGDDEGE